MGIIADENDMVGVHTK